MDMKKIKNVLDMGTGTGIIAIFLQMLKVQHPLFNPLIYASDILEEALECAKNNEKYNNFNEIISFIRSNLFESFPKSFKHSFNIIVFNPPYLPSSELVEQNEKKAPIDRSWNGGVKGYEIFSRFLEEVKDFMVPNDCAIYYISSSRVDLEKLSKVIDKNGFSNQVLNKKHLFFEDIILNKLTLV
jgi:release factor glutamine methyltransferase